MIEPDCEIYNLRQNKMEQLFPFPPESNDGGAARHFGIIEMGGRGGPDIP